MIFIGGRLTGHPSNWLNCTVLSERIPYYILDLLQLTPSVHVPGLGRFEAIFHSAQVDVSRTKIAPPHIEASFNPDEQEDNETLEAFIRYTSGENAGSPKEAIAGFVRSVFKQTAGGSPYEIEHFGTFVQSAEGKIRFTPDWDAFNISFNGLESLELKPNTAPATQFVPLTPPAPYIPKQVSAEVSSEEQEEGAEQAAAASIAAVAQSKEAFQKDLDKIDPSNSRLWWIMLTTAICLIAILCVYLTWDIMTNKKRLDELKQARVDTALTMPIKPDQIPTTDTSTDSHTAQDIPDSVTTPATDISDQTGPPCYIIVGAFGDPANVEKMVARLQTMQYTVEQIKGRTLTKVAIRTSCDQAELQRLLNEVRTSVNPESWIY